MKQNTIDRTQIKLPVITFTDTALRELKLIIENDFTLAGKYFRVIISGKGCDGFTYSAGFTDLAEEDLLISIENSHDEISIIVDPFAAFYLSEVTIDFVMDPINDLEGFVVINRHQKEFHGKFWKEAPHKTPPMHQQLGK
jgi:Fe-S cluster assembly iron-binding protein IscA